MRVTTNQLADIFGVARGTVYGWIKDGIPFVEKGKTGKSSYVFETHDVARWREALAIRQAGGQDQVSKEEAQRRKLSAAASLSELELARQKGDVVELSEMQRNLENDYANFRSSALKVPERCAIRLTGETDEAKIKEIIADEILQALEALSYVKSHWNGKEVEKDYLDVYEEMQQEKSGQEEGDEEAGGEKGSRAGGPRKIKPH